MGNMKRIKALAVLLIASCFCYAQTPETFSGTFSEGLHELCKPGQIVVSPTPQDNLNVSGSSNVVVRSATGITLKPGFSARGWTIGGSFSGKVDQICNGCMGAQNISNNDTCFSVNQTEKEYWLSFEAEADTINIRALFDTTGTCGAEKIELYSGSCGGLVLIEEIYLDSIEPGRILEAEMNIDSLIVNDTYYLKIIKKTAGECLNAEVTYTICLRSGLGGGCVLIPDARDCEDAFLLCGSHMLFTFCPNSGPGDVSEINRSFPVDNWDGCFPSGSPGGVERPTFLRFTIQTAGSLEFVIAPNDPDGTQNQLGPYDWILYRYDNTTCNALAAQQLSPVRCEWNSPTWNGTGMMWNPPFPTGNYQVPINVNCGEEYLLMVNNWGNVQANVIIDFLTNPGDATMGCEPIDQITIEADPSEICIGQSTTLTAAGGTNYQWGLLPGAPTGASLTVSPTQTTTYWVIGNTSCGLTTASHTVIVHQLPTFGFVTEDFTICEPGDDAYMAAFSSCHSGGGTYEWFNEEEESISTNFNVTANPLVETEYTVFATCPPIGCTNQTTVTVSINDLAADGVSLAPSCPEQNMGFASVAASGGETPYIYSWNTSPEQTTDEATGLNPGTYTVTVTDDLGCEVEAEVSISALPDPVVTVTTQNTSCNGEEDGEAWLYVNGVVPDPEDFDILWLPVGTGSAGSVYVTHLAPGNYSASVTAANGCEETEQFTITEPGLLEATISGTEELDCFGDNDGTLTANPTGGTSPYTYYWSTTATTQTINGLEAGTYSVYIEDAHGCKTTIYHTITEPSELVVTATAEDYICGFNLGELHSTVNGGTSGYLYSWTPTNEGILATPTQANTTVNLENETENITYTITVTDANGCIAGATVEVINHTCCPASDPDNITQNGDVSSDWGNGSVLNNSDFSINGNFTIDANFTLSNCDVQLGTDAHIVVNSGVTFTITNGSHLHACQEMWKGIYVSAGGELIVDEQSLIEDAQMAVVLPGGAEYTIEEADFNKNYIHVLLFRFNGTGSNPTGTIKNSRFLCQVTGTTVPLPYPHTEAYTQLLPPYAMYNQSLMGVVSLVLANNTTIGDELAGNLFENTTFGIYAYRSSLESYGNTFKHILPDANCSSTYNQQGVFNCGSGIYAYDAPELHVGKYNTFTDVRTGVYSNMNKTIVDIQQNTFHDVTTGVHVTKAPVGNKQISIIDNTMTDVVRGVFCYQNPGADIEIGNTVSPNDITVNPVSLFGVDFGTGIQVLETQALTATRVKIENNTVDNAPLGIMTQNTWQHNIINANDVTVHDNTAGFPVGILAEHSNYSFIYDNYVSSGNTDQLKSGIEVSTGPMNWISCNTTENIGIGLHLMGALQPSFVLKNEMNTNFRGLQLNQQGTLGNIGLDASTDVAWDNTWVGAFDDANTRAELTNAHSYTIFYRVNESGAPFEPTVNTSTLTSEEFLTNTAGNNLSSISCASENGTQQIVGNDDLKSMVITVLNDTAHSEETSWINKMGIYLALLEDDTLLNSDTVITAYYDSCFIANLGKLIRVNNAFQDADKNFENGKGEDYLDTLQNMSTNILPEGTLKDILSITLEKYLDNSTLVDSTAYQLNQLLLQLFPDSNFTSSATKDFSYTNSQIEELETIAQYCPFVYGPGVYMARAMLSQSDTIPYQYRNECEVLGTGKWDGNDGSSEGTITQESQKEIKVYPNPAKNSLIIELLLGEGELAKLELWSITGAIAQQNILWSGKSDINVANLNSGVYFYSIIINDEQKQTGKQIILK